jgi:hypothetical protein
MAALTAVIVTSTPPADVPYEHSLAVCYTCGFLCHRRRKNPDYPACCEPSVRRSLQCEKSPERRFLKVLCVKRNKLLVSKSYNSTEPFRYYHPRLVKTTGPPPALTYPFPVRPQNATDSTFADGIVIVFSHFSVVRGGRFCTGERVVATKDKEGIYV